MSERYCIVTEHTYLDSYDTPCDYERFKEYSYEAFVTVINDLTLRAKQFRAFRITPISVTTTVNINIGQ
jgi:hypothetical protein